MWNNKQKKLGTIQKSRIFYLLLAFFVSLRHHSMIHYFELSTFGDFTKSTTFPPLLSCFHLSFSFSLSIAISLSLSQFRRKISNFRSYPDERLVPSLVHKPDALLNLLPALRSKAGQRREAIAGAASAALVLVLFGGLLACLPCVLVLLEVAQLQWKRLDFTASHRGSNLFAYKYDYQQQFQR